MSGRGTPVHLSDSPDGSISHDLPPDTAPLAELRRWVSDHLADTTEEVQYAAMLVCTELAVNAYEHASAPRDIRLCRSSDRRSVRIEVDDGSPRDRPVLGRSRLRESRGRGLLLIDRLATTWGTDELPGGKTVWAELAT
jgi:anti-sigma regulatory factor (Ser/Thr protein kinase)